MSETTENLKLILPYQEENYDVDIVNHNNTIIDDEIKKLKDGIKDSDSGAVEELSKRTFMTPYYNKWGMSATNKEYGYELKFLGNDTDSTALQSYFSTINVVAVNLLGIITLIDITFSFKDATIPIGTKKATLSWYSKQIGKASDVMKRHINCDKFPEHRFIIGNSCVAISKPDASSIELEIKLIATQATTVNANQGISCFIIAPMTGATGTRYEESMLTDATIRDIF